MSFIFNTRERQRDREMKQRAHRKIHNMTERMREREPSLPACPACHACLPACLPGHCMVCVQKCVWKVGKAKGQMPAFSILLLFLLNGRSAAHTCLSALFPPFSHSLALFNSGSHKAGRQKGKQMSMLHCR